jgi:2-amino-4-hydroxy-6-hydroxymethyldihydropteridine diphosphokinase
MDCVIGLGANLGEPQRTFESTLVRLREHGNITALSNLYENPAVGGPPQPDYLNGAVRFSTDLSGEALLVVLQKLEQDAGRERTVPWGPRTLDLDLLWISGQSLDTPQLTVPHPRLLERAFALQPLVEVAPKAVCPKTHRNYNTLVELLDLGCLKLFATAIGPSWKWVKPTLRPRSAQPSPQPTVPPLR